MDNLKIPRHVAVIMDGNGRWAKSKGLPRKMGHVQGGKNVEDMLYVCDDLGIKYHPFESSDALPPLGPPLKYSETHGLPLCNFFFFLSLSPSLSFII